MCDKRSFQPVTKKEADIMIEEYNESVRELERVFYGDEKNGKIL